jgi:ectoine hydroxylase-related dioxygenase (phytanoyl-CoA dioxygenase family)
MKMQSLTKTQVQYFIEKGYLVISNFYDDEEIVPIQKAIYDIIGIVATKYGIKIDRQPFTPEIFDEGYLDIIKVNRNYGGEIYDAVKQIPAFIRLVSSKKSEAIFKDLRPNSFAGVASAGYGLRINNPYEDKYRANWHQEYPSQLRSLDGLVFWSPLIRVTQELGPVVICPGSHIEGAVPVYTQDPRNKEKQGAYSLVLHEEAALIAKYNQIAPLSKPNDLIVMDFLLLHASGYNVSQRALWSMQFRYFNFLETTGISHGWKGGFASGIDFRTVHPELCVDL